MNRALDIDRPMAAVRTVLLPGCPRRSLNRGIAVLAVAASIAASGAAYPQSSLPEPDAAAPGTTAPQATQLSAWDAPEPWRTDRFFLATSVYTKHFNYNPAHDDHQNLIQGEWNVTEQWLAGAALFDNSFGQATQYVYGGYRFRPLEQLQPLYLKVSAGLVHGYSGQYQDKIPFNNLGTAPVIIPSIGYCVNRFCSEAVFFGIAGVMVTIGVTVP
jgi:hypothetical protein